MATFRIIKPLIMRHFLIIFVALLCLFSMNAEAQKRKLRKADHYFNLFEFNQAIKFYDKVIAKRPETYKALSNLAEIARITGNYKEAEKWYGEVVKQPEATPLQKFYYAQMLRTSQKYDEAKKYYLEYAQLTPDDDRGQKLADGIDQLNELKADSLNYRTFGYEFNTPVSEFSPAFYDSAIVFPSARGSGKIDVWSNSPFLNLYVSQKTDTGFLSPTPLPGDINEKYHEGPATFDTSFTTMYFTRNNFVKGGAVIVVNKDAKDKEPVKKKRKLRKKRTSSQGIMKLKVFKSTKVGDEWKKVVELPFNSNEYSVGHPTLSRDGRYLYFASDMPDSNAMGKQDLYVVELTSDSTFSKPVNLGPGINTKGDEVFPFIADNGDLYFASDSYYGFGGLDIYKATKNEDGTWGNVVNMGYPLNSNMDDFGLIYKDDVQSGYFSSNRDGGKGDDDIYMFDQKVPIILVGKVVDKKTGERIPNADVKLLNNLTGLSDSLTADENGEFQFTIRANNKYTATADKYGYFLISPINVSTFDLRNDTIKIVLEMQNIEVGEIVKLENIYYDFDKYNIRPDAAKELDRFVSFMKKYPELVVELRSHTDSRGSDTYNQWLSTKRAESAVNYVISHGVDKSRISAKGYGESIPVNKCVNGVPCTEEEHQLNRRTEFLVVEQPEGLKVKSSVSE